MVHRHSPWMVPGYRLLKAAAGSSLCASPAALPWMRLVNHAAFSSVPAAAGTPSRRPWTIPLRLLAGLGAAAVVVQPSAEDARLAYLIPMRLAYDVYIAAAIVAGVPSGGGGLHDSRLIMRSVISWQASVLLLRMRDAAVTGATMGPFVQVVHCRWHWRLHVPAAACRRVASRHPHDLPTAQAHAACCMHRIVVQRAVAGGPATCLPLPWRPAQASASLPTRACMPVQTTSLRWGRCKGRRASRRCTRATSAVRSGCCSCALPTAGSTPSSASTWASW